MYLSFTNHHKDMNKRIQMNHKKGFFLKKAAFLFAVLLLTFGTVQKSRANNDNNMSFIASELNDRIVSLSVKNETIKSILYKLQAQTSINFVIEDNALKLADSKKSIVIESLPLSAALKKVFANTDLAYSLTNNAVVVHKSIPVPAVKAKDQVKLRAIKGKVLDTDKKPVIGAVVLIKETNRGTVTDAQGNFSLDAEDGDVLEFSIIGYKSTDMKITKNTKNIIMILELDVADMGDVTVVAFGKQKKESIVSAITTVNAKDLKSSSSDLTTQFAGKIAGMVGWQTGGLPGALKESEMNTKFYIRGITSFQTSANLDPLILLDGVESSKLDLARLNPDDIESFSVLKDATATSMYGARGANGVIIVETKKGTEGKVYTTVSYEVIASQPTNQIDVVDPITYMGMYNQALLNYDNTASPKYSIEDINRTASKKYPNWLYPANDWYKTMFKPISFNHHMGVTIRGGSSTLQYYASVNHNSDQGMLKTDGLNQFDVNIKNSGTSFRVNLNINLAAGIKLNINSSANIDKNHGPLTDVSQAYGMAFGASPVDFAPMYPADEVYGWPHLRFGGQEGSSSNPYMELHKGYIDRSRISATNKAEYIQDLSRLLNIKGLEFRASAAFSNEGYYSKGFVTSPAQYELSSYNFETGKHSLRDLTKGAANRVLTQDQNSTGSSASRRDQYDARLYHVAAWGNHQTSLTAVAQAMTEDNSSSQNVLTSFEQRNLGLSFRGTYGYKDKYFFEGSFGYNGSERFAKDNRMGFFPAGGLAWVISKEKFMKGVSGWLPFLKARASYGFVGNDGVIEDPRFVYLQSISSSGLRDPEPGGTSFNGYGIASYANPHIGWETAETINLGLESKMFKGLLEFNIDAYQQIRHNILANRITVPAHVGIGTPQLDNVGKSLSRGIDISLKIQKQLSNDFWFILNGTVTYNEAKFLDYLEAPNKPSWQLKNGQELSQQMGYIAEGLFRDQAEIANSAVHPGTPQPGDIRYRDINSDGTIDVEDAVFIGYPETPRLTYGLNGNFSYKNFEFGFAFQGSGNRTFFMNPSAISPFVGGKALLTDIYEDHWSHNNMATMPLWPNLTTEGVTKNNPLEDWYATEGEVRKSTYFMRDVAFLRCTSLELGYYMPKYITKKLNLQNLKFYVRTNNPFIISSFKTWDVELGENGFNYPIQRTFSLGLNIGF